MDSNERIEAAGTIRIVSRCMVQPWSGAQPVPVPPEDIHFMPWDWEREDGRDWVYSSSERVSLLEHGGCRGLSHISSTSRITKENLSKLMKQ
jgi:hypothetical protein